MKIRTDFVTNSSSASYIVEIDVVADNGDGDSFELMVDPEEASNIHLDVREDKHGVYVAGEDKAKGYITRAKDLQELCKILFGAIEIDGYLVEEDDSQNELNAINCMNKVFAVSGKLSKFFDQSSLKEYVEDSGGLLENEVSENTDFLVTNNLKSTSTKINKAKKLNVPIITEDEFIEKFGFRKAYEETRYEDIFAEKVFSDTFNEYTEIIKSSVKNRENLKSIIIWNKKNGYGDSASWISFEDNSELEAMYNRYQSAGLDEKKGIFEDVYNYMDSSPVMVWRDNEGEEDGPRQVIWSGTEEELHDFVTHFLENRRENKKYWMVYPSEVYDINMKTGSMKEDYVLKMDKFSDFFVPARKAADAPTAHSNAETTSGPVMKDDFHRTVQVEEKNEAYYSEQIGIEDFEGKSFVLTECTYSKEIAQFILKRRGVIKSSMSKKVQVLIFNSTKTTKHDDALKLKQGGWDIKLISEADFMKEYGIKPAMNSESKKTEKEKVIETLVKLYGIQGEGNPVISKVHLKYYAGFDYTENVIKALSNLQDREIILVSKGVIEILNPEALKSLIPSN